MLLRFEFSNFLSIKSSQELNLTASSLKEESSYLVRREGVHKKILPCVGIYGANASGKSNTLSAFHFFRRAILNSHTAGSPDGGVPRKPFLLDVDSGNMPSTFECDVLIGTTRYYYGFTIDSDVVLGEWLYSFPRGSRRVLFDRDSSNKKVFEFGRFLKGKNKTIEGLTRDNSLFLSAAAQNNHEELSLVYNYFKNNFKFRQDLEPQPNHFLADYLNDAPLKNKIVDFLKLADIGIDDVKIEDVEVDEKSKRIQEGIDKLFKDNFGSAFPGIRDVKRKSIELGHSRSDGRSTFFELSAESRGTRSLLSIIGPILDALSHGKTFFVDEIGSSMHPALTYKLVSLFASAETNPKGAQLIFTTHDSSLLSCGLLRRDEIWFTEKTKAGETRLYSLSDFKTRPTDNFQKGYLQGSFGSNPFLGCIDQLFIANEGE